LAFALVVERILFNPVKPWGLEVVGTYGWRELIKSLKPAKAHDGVLRCRAYRPAIGYGSSAIFRSKRRPVERDFGKAAVWGPPSSWVVGMCRSPLPGFRRWPASPASLHVANQTGFQAGLATYRICVGTMGIEPLNADGVQHMMSKNEAWTR
jgi:hypothetical protein